MWAAIAGVANATSIAFGPGFYPAWFILLVAVGFGLLLPAIANLHVRHQPLRPSGAVLATAAGTVTVALGIAAAGSFDLVVAALLVRGVWWWTMGKMWFETAALPRWFGVATMILAVIAVGAAIASLQLGPFNSATRTLERPLVGLWSLGLAVVLWRCR